MCVKSSSVLDSLLFRAEGKLNPDPGGGLMAADGRAPFAGADGCIRLRETASGGQGLPASLSAEVGPVHSSSPLSRGPLGPQKTGLIWPLLDVGKH